MPATKMTDAQKIERVAERNGWDFYAGYSGRCMFGATCPGIVCPPYDAKAAEAAVRRAGVKAGASRDSLGRDCIVYWSSVDSGPVNETQDDEGCDD